MRVTVDSGRAIVNIRSLSLTASRRQKLLGILGAGQLLSIQRTFADEGSPAGSWPKLSDASLRWRKYTPGHKLLQDSGRLKNSIRFEVVGNTVRIGTNVAYAGVHQRGFRGTQNVRTYSYTRKNAGADAFGKQAIVNRAGRNQTVRRKMSSGVTFVTVKAHTRNITIPARPFLVFRPEDPARMADEVRTFLAVVG